MPEAEIELDRNLSIPHAEEWLGYWFMEPRRGMALLKYIQSLDMSVHLQQVTVHADSEDREPPPPPPARSEKWSGAFIAEQREVVRLKNGYDYELVDGVALTELSGKLMKHVGSGGGTSTVMMRQTFRAMLRDDRVKAVLVRIDSPGGTVAGAFDLARDVAALSAAKPVHAYIEDLGASAAYLQAAQMTAISANANAEVGSIGTVGVVYDESASAAMQGIKVHVIAGRVDGKRAPMKGAGAPGSEITQAHLERWQEEIDDLNEQFIQAVVSGRKMSRERVEAAADGGVWISARASTKGLVDRIESMDEMYTRVRTKVDQDPKRKKQETNSPAEAGATSADPGASAPAEQAPGVTGQTQEVHMSTTATAPAGQASATGQQQTAAEPKAASVAEIKAACPGASSDFVLECAEKQLTLAQAKDAFIQWQGAQIRTRDEELAKKPAQPQQQAAAGTGRKTGVAPIQSGAAEQDASYNGGDPVADFNAAVEQQMTKPGYKDDRKKAISAVIRQSPDLHQAYLVATNPGAEARQKIKMKFE